LSGGGLGIIQIDEGQCFALTNGLEEFLLKVVVHIRILQDESFD
jgi:hypothetical protein